MFAEIEQFLAEHLDGRLQDDVAPEVAERLADLRIDVADVTMPKTTD